MSKEKTKALDRAAILGVQRMAPLRVWVEEWEGSVWLQPMMSADYDTYQDELIVDRETGETSLKNFRAKYLVRCLVTEEGDRLLSDEDAAELGKGETAVVSRLHSMAMELNGGRLGKEELEEAAGNLGGGQSSDSVGDSAAS